MDRERMEAAEELLPVGVRLAVELDDPWQQNERCTKGQRRDPCPSCCLAFRESPVSECGESSTICHASRPCTTLAGVGPVSF